MKRISWRELVGFWHNETSFKHAIRMWWLKRLEHHYLICADVEEKRAREANLNAVYYAKRAMNMKLKQIDQ